MDTQILNDHLNSMWKDGRIDKESVPFLRTAINRPLRAFWHYFVLRAMSRKSPRIFFAGFGFLKHRYRDEAMLFLKKYFPGLIVFNYFADAWSEESDKPAMNCCTPPDNVRPFNRTVNS
jgi:hypothetical protein